jgi:hypothetical protein
MFDSNDTTFECREGRVVNAGKFRKPRSASSFGGVDDPKLHPPAFVGAKDKLEFGHRQRTAMTTRTCLSVI